MVAHYLDALRYLVGASKMACDIHWYSETKKDGTWRCDQAESFHKDEDPEYEHHDMNNFPNGERDYWMFGLLADVRCDVPYGFAAKGIPDELSPEVKTIFDELDDDGHSHSYLTREELKAKLAELALKRAELLIAPVKGATIEIVVQHHIGRLKEIIGNLDADVPDSDQRIIFCFDN